MCSGERRARCLAIHLCHSIFGPIPAPGYHLEGMYEFQVDLDGDAAKDLIYRFSFDNRDGQGAQRYVVRRIPGAAAVNPDARVSSSRGEKLARR
jgi:hypothetical protein